MALTYTLIDMYTKSKRRQQLGLSMETTLWLNAAYYAGDSVGYYQGFRFFVLDVFSLDGPADRGGMKLQILCNIF